MAQTDQNGFSLIETLVAMTVLAVSATAILSATEGHTKTITAINERMMASWVAQNTMVELELAHEVPAAIRMGGLEWQIRINRTGTNDPELGRADITVATVAAPDVVLARLTGFLDIAGDGSE